MSGLLGRIPGIAWVIALAAVAIAGATWAIYATGRRAGAAAVHRAALVDSARVAHAVVDSASRETDVAVRHARVSAAKSASVRDQWELQREAARAALEQSPAPAIALVEAARSAIAQQDSTIHLQAVALDAYAAERDARVRADTIEAHQIDTGIEDGGGATWRRVAIVGAIAGAAVWAMTHVAH